jgi:hypothetical protein
MANAVLPIPSSRPADLAGTSNFLARQPNAVMNVLQASFRVGQVGDRPIGMVQKVSWSMSRKLKEVYQLEALPDTTFYRSAAAVDLTKPGQYTTNTSYYPGEVAEIVPGVQEPIEINLERAVMQNGTGLEALLNTGDAAEYAAYNGGAGYDPFATFTQVGGAPTRGITPLQQVRPIALYCLFLSPTRAYDVIYGIKFVDCWIEKVEGWDVGADAEGPIIEKLTLKCPKVRLYQSQA